MIKLVVTDLDGSLLNDQKELPANFWEIERKLSAAGIKLAIASGRPHHNLVNLFAPVKDDVYFLSDNGSYVTYRGKELLVSPLDHSAVKTFVELSRPLENIYPVLCGKEKAYMEDNDQDLLKLALQYYQDYEIVDDLTKVEEVILKVSLCDLIDAETNSYPLYKQFENDYKVAVAGERWLDFTAFDANKGVAVKLLQEQLNILPEETMVFGDYLNDLDMMHAAKYSYAMKNAHPGIIEAANFVTELDNNENGVLATIENFLELRHPIAPSIKS